MARVTLREIADRVGCSRSAVSYALKNRPNISPTVRDKVLKAAEELGWMPDARLAQQMALVRRTKEEQDLPNLAVVINKPRREIAMEHAPRRHFDGVVGAAREYGYNINVFNLAEDPLTPRRLRGILQARGVQGVVFIATINPGMPETYLEIGHEFACAVVGVRYPNMPYHVTIPDFLAAGRLAILNLLEVGFQRPAVIIPKGVDVPLGWGFSGGVSAGLQDLPTKERLPLLLVGRGEPFIPGYEYPRICKWLRKHKPDAILSVDVDSLPVLVRGSELDDIPRYSLDFFPHQDVAGGIDQRHTEIGEAAVDVVMAQLHRGEVGLPKVQRAILVEGVWRVQHASERRKSPAMEDAGALAAAR